MKTIGYKITEDKAFIKDLDAHFKELYIPEITSVCEKLGLKYEIVPEITSKYGEMLERELTVCLHSENFTRFHVKLSQGFWMVTVSSFITIPSELDFNMTKQIMSNSRFVGSPPELSFESGSQDFTLKFESGYGEGGSLKIDHEGCFNRINDAIIMHKKLEEFYKFGLKEDSVHNLIEILLEVFEGY